MARLQDEKFSKGLETVRALMLHPEFEASLGANIRAEGGARRAVEALKREFDLSGENEGVVVPDFEAVEIVRMIQNHRKDQLDIDSRYFSWDFFDGLLIEKEMRNGRGKTFRVEKWRPEKTIHPAEARTHFMLRARGHAAAFVSWVALTDPEDGLYICAPHDEAYFHEGVQTLVPFANVYKGKTTLSLMPTNHILHEHNEPTFVAFSRIKTGQRVLLVK